MESTIKTISPEIAQILLENNTLNRSISDGRVAFYARQMKEGMWKVNGETIIISDTGRLLEGQHRLWACIQAGVPFTTFVAEGVPENTFDTIDTGKSRSPGDILHIAGYSFANRIASAARFYLVIKRGSPASMNSGTSKVPGPELLTFVKDNPGLIDIVKTVASDTFLKEVIPGGVISALTYIFSEDDSFLAEEWFTALRTGVNLSPGNAVLALRQRLISVNMKRPRPRTTEFYTYCVNSWNSFIRGESLQTIKGSYTTANGVLVYPKIAKVKRVA